MKINRCVLLDILYTELYCFLEMIDDVFKYERVTRSAIVCGGGISFSYFVLDGG